MLGLGLGNQRASLYMQMGISPSHRINGNALPGAEAIPGPPGCWQLRDSTISEATRVISSSVQGVTRALGVLARIASGGKASHFLILCNGGNDKPGVEAWRVESRSTPAVEV